MSDEVKAAMTRRMNAMFEALRAVEWSVENGFAPLRCPICGGEKPTHQNVDGESLGRDAVSEPCPIGFALSEAAYTYGQPCHMVTTRTHEDGSRFLFRPIPVGGSR